MPTKEQARQIVSAVGKQAIKYSALMTACPFITEQMLSSIIQDDYVGNSQNATRWNMLARDTPLLRFVNVPRNYLPHYHFADTDCFELAPEGLNLLYDIENEMKQMNLATESLNEAKRANKLSEEANAIAKSAKRWSIFAIVVAVAIGFISIAVSVWLTKYQN